MMVTIDESFETWLPMHVLAVSSLPNYGECPVVYALRETATKEILKFGHTGHLRRRIIGNYMGGVGGTTTQRIHSSLFVEGWIDHVEVAWLAAKDKTDAERMEKALRYSYMRTHGKLPPWDRQL